MEEIIFKSMLSCCLGSGGRGLDFDSPSNRTDVAKLGKCDDICKEFAEKMGWKVIMQ